MLQLTKLRMDFFFQRIVAQSVEVADVTRSSILSAAQCPEANSVLFRVPGCGVSCQQFALHAQGRVKLAKKAHHSGRREGDCNHHFSLGGIFIFSFCSGMVKLCSQGLQPIRHWSLRPSRRQMVLAAQMRNRLRQCKLCAPAFTTREVYTPFGYRC